MANILPRDLPASGPVNPASVLVVDNNVSVDKATPIQLVDAAIPLASQADAEAGTDNTKRMTPLRVWQAITEALSTFSGGSGASLVGFIQSGTGAISRTVQSKFRDDISVLDFGAVGDNSTDDLAAFNAATSACIAQSKKLVIPRRSYVLSGAWTITNPIDVDMDPSANLRFTNAASAGVVLDFRAASANFGLNTIRIGGLYSPAINASFAFPGYPSSWAASSRSTLDAITLMGGSRINIEAQYVAGWNAEFRPKGTYDGVNGARAPLNINYRCNTGDLNTYGVYFDGGPANGGSMGAIYCEWNTCFAKFPVFYDAATRDVSQCNARITGQAFVNEAGGAAVFAKGSGARTCTVDIAWCYAGYSAYDSPTGTSATLTVPLVAGDVASNGQTTDGNASVGYFAGSNNSIRVGLAVDQAAFPGGRVPASGVVTRIRDAGAGNKMVVGLYETTQGAPVALATTQGEANYNGGVGGASISRVTLVSLPVPSLTNNATATLYLYNCLLTDGQAKPLRIVPLSNQIGNSKMTFNARDNAATVNRECIVEVTNVTGATVAAATYFAWIVVDG